MVTCSTDLGCSIGTRVTRVTRVAQSKSDTDVTTTTRRHLVDVEAFNDAVEGGVEVVEQVDDSHRVEASRERREADDVAEVDGHVVVHFRGDGLSVLQLLDDRPATRRTRYR